MSNSEPGKKPDEPKKGFKNVTRTSLILWICVGAVALYSILQGVIGLIQKG